MATEVILPMLGETMNEGTIVAWSKNEGDAVRPGDVLYTVESDKATLEVEATAAGFLRRILAPAGTTVAVLSVVAYITATPDEIVSAPTPRAAAAPTSMQRCGLGPGGSSPWAPAMTSSRSASGRRSPRAALTRLP